MTGRDLRAARLKLVGDRRGSVVTMSAKLETAYRTYQGWEARKGAIPGVAGVAVKGLLLIAEIEAWGQEPDPVDRAK